MRCSLYLLLAFVTSFSSLAFAQAPPAFPGPVCYQNTAETIGQGVLIPIPSAQIRICTPGSSQTACAASGGLIAQNLFTDQTETTRQPNPITADVGGNFYFCTASTHFAMLIVSGQGDFWTPDLNLVDNWSGGGTISGNVLIGGDLTVEGSSGFVGTIDATTGGIQGFLIGNASTATDLQNAPTTCATSGQYSYGINVAGNAYCNPLYYQAIGANGVGQTPRNQINFSTNFALTDSSSPNRTNVDLASTISSNTSGTAAHATALASAPTNCGTSVPAYGIGANGNALCLFGTHGQIEAATFDGGFCTTGTTTYSLCSSTITWPTPFSDGDYAMSCSSSSGTTTALTGVFESDFTATGFTLSLQNGATDGTGAVSISQLSCIAIHT